MLNVNRLACRLASLAVIVLATYLPTTGQTDRSIGMGVVSAEANAQLVTAREAMLSFRLDEAEAAFRALYSDPGNELPAFYHLTAIVFIKAMFEQEEPAYQRFFASADSLYDLIKDAEQSAWRSYFRAELFLMRAFVRARRGDFIRAAVAAREAYKTYIESLRADPTLIDAERGVGVLKTIIGATPTAYRRFLRMFGYKGSVEEGLKLLQHAADKGEYNQTESLLFLAVTKVFLNVDRDSGLDILASRFEQTNDPVSGLMYTFALRMARRPEEAVSVAQSAIETMENGDFDQVAFLYYHLGSALFSLNRFSEAEIAYRRYVEVFHGQSYQAGARLRIGLSLEMQDRGDEAVAWYRQVEAATDFDADQAAQHEAQFRQRNPLQERDKILLRGRNAISAGAYERAIETLETLFFNDSEPQLARTESAYLIGRALHLLERREEAATKYLYVKTHPVSRDERWAPWATYYLGKVRAETGSPEEAGHLFKEAIRFKGNFDYQKSLERNAKLALEELEIDE